MSDSSSVSSTTSTYTNTSSGRITFSGLGNGTDFTEIIDATIEAESYRLDEYKTEKAEQEKIISALETLSDEMASLNSTLEDMNGLDSFLAMDASSSSTAVGAEVSGEAVEGTHTVVVEQLAQSDIWANTGYSFSSEDALVASSATTLAFSYAGSSITLDVAAGTTIDGLVDAINSSSLCKGKVQASLIYDGASYYFLLSGEDTGSANTISIVDGGTLAGFDSSNFTNTQTAQDSLIRVDGFPPGADQWIARSTNAVDDVLTGVTLNLKAVTGDEGMQVTVAYDTDAIVEMVESFVKEVNQILYDIQTLTGRLDTDYENPDAVSTDASDDSEDDDDDTITLKSSTLDIMYGNIKSILSSLGLGFARYDSDTGTGDTYGSLSQIGISTDSEEGSDSFGQLVLDTSVLEEALAKDPRAVAELFAADGELESDNSALQPLSIISGVTPAGDHEVAYTVENGVLVSATIDGQAAQLEGWTITGTGSLSSGLYIQVADQSDGDHSGTVRVKQGKIGQLSDALSAMTAEETGTLAIMVNNYEKGVEDLGDRIDSESARLDALETYLSEKYSRLDETLSYYTNLESTLSSLISSLSD